MYRLPPRLVVDRLLREAELETDPTKIRHLIRLARAYAALALADEARTANLLRLIDFADDPDSELPDVAKRALLAIIRRRLDIFPPAFDEDTTPNGGS